MHICYESGVVEVESIYRRNTSNSVRLDGNDLDVETDNFSISLTLYDDEWACEIQYGDNNIVDWFTKYINSIGHITPEHLPEIYNHVKGLMSFSNHCKSLIDTYMTERLAIQPRTMNVLPFNHAP